MYKHTFLSLVTFLSYIKVIFQKQNKVKKKKTYRAFLLRLSKDKNINSFRWWKSYMPNVKSSGMLTGFCYKKFFKM